MNFIVSSSTLKSHLKQISGVLNNSNTLPILDHFYFELDNAVLKVTASDLDNTIRTQVPVKSESTGTICIPAKILMATLNELPELPISFTVNLTTFGIELSAGDGKYKIAGNDGDEYPKHPLIEAASSFDIHSHILSNAVNKTLFATGNDDLRPMMNGVFFQLSPEEVTFVATDAHKLVSYKRTDVRATNTASFIVPKKPLNLLKNTCASMDEQVRVEYNETNALFKFGSFELTCRLIDGKYPNYEAVIPKNNPNILTVGRTDLARKISLVSIYSNKTTHQVRLKISGNELNLTAEDLDYANEANERMTCQYQGEDIEIGFNSKFIVEMLNNIDTDEINIEMSAPNRAGIILPSVKENAHEDILMLVMPIMLNR